MHNLPTTSRSHAERCKKIAEKEGLKRVRIGIFESFEQCVLDEQFFLREEFFLDVLPFFQYNGFIFTL